MPLLAWKRSYPGCKEAMASIQDTYGKDHLELTVVKSYLKRLLGNSRVVSYLVVNRPEYLPEFQSIVDIASTMPPEN